MRSKTLIDKHALVKHIIDVCHHAMFGHGIIDHRDRPTKRPFRAFSVAVGKDTCRIIGEPDGNATRLYRDVTHQWFFAHDERKARPFYLSAEVVIEAYDAIRSAEMVDVTNACIIEANTDKPDYMGVRVGNLEIA